MTYGKRNAGVKQELHPAMQLKLLQLEERLLLIREDILYTHGWRSFSEQDDLWRVGRGEKGVVIGRTVTDARGGWSLHNFGAAVDFAPVVFLFPIEARGKLAWAAIARFKEVGAQAKKIGFTWGGDWRLKDYGHLQYTQGLTILDFREGATLDYELAKKEYIADLSDQLRKVTEALERGAVTPTRKKTLTLAQERLHRKLERVRNVLV